MTPEIQIIDAPSVLGLTLSGVQYLSRSLLQNGLREKLQTKLPVRQVADLNHLYSEKRDDETDCLNPSAIHEFSLSLKEAVTETINQGRFPLVLGGDCSILIGVMTALKQRGEHGLVFVDAHADFYLPHQSGTGEVADMDLGIITGHGPEILTDIDKLKPYVLEKNVVQVGQRDEEETKKYDSQEIRDTEIKCMSLAEIRGCGIEVITAEILKYIDSLSAQKFWIHFDTDVLSDEINPAVEYRLPGGLQFHEVEYLVQHLLSTGKIAGMTVTIFNPLSDPTGKIGSAITESLVRMYQGAFQREVF